MSKEETDILLISKYLKGELDPAAMHRLERRALDDPFLMDAIEGYEKHGVADKHLSFLNDRLNARISKKQARIIPWKMISIAASVLIVLGAGGVWFYRNEKQPTEQRIASNADTVHTATIPQDAASVKQPKPDAVPPLRKVNKPALVMQKPVYAADKMVKMREIPFRPAPATTDTAATDATPLDEMIVMDYHPAKNKKAVAAAKPADSINRKKPINFNNQLLPAKVDGVNVTAAAPTKSYDSESIYTNNLPSRSFISGTVISKDDGAPLPGAIVKVAGSNRATQTDASGKFRIAVDSNKANQLQIGSIGYQSVEVSAAKPDSLKSIALNPASSALSEVIVTGYTSKSKTANNEVVTDARPMAGWGTFKKYLAANAVSPDHKNGVVKLLLSIAGNGTITEIKVVKGLSTATDQKAVELINNGPAWAGSSTGKPATVTVRIKFGQ